MQMQMEDGLVDDLIKSLYCALVLPNGFTDFLNELTLRLNLRSGAVVMLNNELQSADIVWVKGLDLIKTAEYGKRYGERDGLAQRLLQAPPGKLIVLGEYEMDQGMLSDPECMLAVQALDVYYAAAAVLASDDCWSSRVYFQRNREQGEFSPEECLLLNKLIPHIQHAMQLYHLKLKSDKQHFLSELLFDQILLPVILLDEQGYVSHCNQQAELFFAQHQYLKKINKSLHWINVRSNRQIQQAIQKCLREQTTHHLQLEMPKGLSIVLTFVPLVHKNNNGGGIAVFIYSQNLLPVNQQVLCELYNLSTKEALVCSELISGRSPAEIAENTYLSYETVRTYIKRIMKKTDTRRQSELVAKVLASPACNLMSHTH
ncbi:LuxR C-terminal-related transcriptional regulator [Psychromonas sp.]|uniref:LuxR C-terminal-related transcriptional regulator n=1 Tax=Psychromonas sp. TaxID=1884585 RepID=UPI0039E3DCFA